MKGQIVADFIVGHRVHKQLDLNVGYVSFTPWKLHFDGSICKDGCGVGVVIISPSGAVFEALNRLDHDCTNNQTEYEALLFGLEILCDMGVKHVEAYGDSLLVVQQVSKVCQCLNGFLNAYLDKCLDIISCMDEFVIYHVPREENPRANALAQQAPGYNVRKRNFQEHKPLLTAECFALEAPVRPTQPTGLTGDNGLTDVTEQSALTDVTARSDQSLRSGSVHGTGLTYDHGWSDRSPDKDFSSDFCDKNEVEDWRKPLVDYLHNPSSSVDRKVRR
jgi:ribonuclease HI/probable phosphoglycerate mutase